MSYLSAGPSLKERKLLHHAKVGQFLDELRRHHPGVGTDITLLLKNGATLPIHSAVAAAHSSYFRQLIHNRGSRLHIDVSTSPREDAIKAVVDYMYSGNINADLNELGNLLHVASVWQMNALSTQLESRLLAFSEQPCTLLKALDIVGQNKDIVSPSTRSAVYGHAVKNFQQVTQSPDFSRLSPYAVIALLSSDELPLNSELDVARVVLSYLRHVNRQYDEHLLGVIRFEHLDAAEVAQLQHLVRSQNSTLATLLDRIMQSVRAGMFHAKRPRRRFGSSFVSSRQQQPSVGQREGSTSLLPNVLVESQKTASSCGNALGFTPFGTAISQAQFLPQQSAQHSPAYIPRVQSHPFEYNLQHPGDGSQAYVNRNLRTKNSIIELRKVPDVFSGDGGIGGYPFVTNNEPSLSTTYSVPTSQPLAYGPTKGPWEYSPYLQDRTQQTVNRNLRSKGSVFEIRKLPDVFQQSSAVGSPADRFDYTPYAEHASQTAINRNLRTKDSVFEIRNTPDLFDGAGSQYPLGCHTRPLYAKEAVGNYSTETNEEYVDLPDPFGAPKESASTTLEKARALNASSRKGKTHAPSYSSGSSLVPRDYDPFTTTNTGHNRIRNSDSIQDIARVPDVFGSRVAGAPTHPQNAPHAQLFQQPRHGVYGYP